MSLEVLIERIATEQRIPGLAIAVQRGGDLLYEGYHGFANLEHRVPVIPETVFEIASVTKLFTAQTILHFAQHGRLNLDDLLTQHLTGLPDSWGGVTIRHCLMHQSGIPNYTSQDTYWTLTRRDKTHAEILALVDQLPLSFQAGERYAYDNTGYYLLGMVIEAISGKKYGDTLKHVIFDPLSMTTTQANDYDQIVPHRAQGYVRQESGDGLLNKPFYSTSNTFSAGILLSTVRDLLKWRASLFDDTVLNAEYRKLWWTPNPSKAANERAEHFSVGLGWFFVDSPLGLFHGHNGGIAGFASSFVYFPDTDVAAVVLCNSSAVAAPHEIAFEVIRQFGEG
jgi:CubicO group peptidase (beta-lactamase class C family)